MSLIASLSYQQAQRLASSLWSNKFAHTADGSQPWGDEEKPASRWTLSSVCWSSASSTCSRKYTCRLIYSRAREMSTLVNVWIICLEGAVRAVSNCSSDVFSIALDVKAAAFWRTCTHTAFICVCARLLLGATDSARRSLCQLPAILFVCLCRWNRVLFVPFG